jgi:hypothetical protein
VLLFPFLSTTFQFVLSLPCLNSARRSASLSNDVVRLPQYIYTNCRFFYIEMRDHCMSDPSQFAICNPCVIFLYLANVLTNQPIS